MGDPSVEREEDEDEMPLMILGFGGSPFLLSSCLESSFARVLVLVSPALASSSSFLSDSSSGSGAGESSVRGVRVPSRGTSRSPLSNGGGSSLGGGWLWGRSLASWFGEAESGAGERGELLSSCVPSRVGWGGEGGGSFARAKSRWDAECGAARTPFA